MGGVMWGCTMTSVSMCVVHWPSSEGTRYAVSPERSVVNSEHCIPCARTVLMSLSIRARSSRSSGATHR